MSEGFFKQVADPCNDWYHNASKVFLNAQDQFVPKAKFLYERKLLLTRYGKNAYHAAMDSMIDEIDSLTDAQRELGAVYKYANKYMVKVHDHFNKGSKYRIPLKWSLKVSHNCYEEEQRTANRV